MKFKIDWGVHALYKLIEAYEFQTVLDIGSGDGEHKRFFEYFDKEVTSVDFAKDADYSGDFMEIDFKEQYDLVWCSHVLEHQRNVGAFLEKIYTLIKDDGVLAVMVPIQRPEKLIAGHISSWSTLLLCYNLILSGFDCSKVRMLSSYEVSLIVKKKQAVVNPLFKHSVIGEETEDPMKPMSKYFPFEAFNGAELSTPGGWEWGKLYPSMPKTVDILSKNANKFN